MAGIRDFVDNEEDVNILDDLEIIAPIRRPRHIYVRPNHFDCWDDADFVTRFRLRKATVEMLHEKLHNHLLSATDRNSALSPMCKLLLALRYYALGSMFIAIGDFAGVCKTSAWKAVREVTLALASLSQEVIKFPTTVEEIQRAQIEFHRIARFPKVVGALDCTHVEIQSPGGECAEIYRNRKGWFSINIQTICSAKLEIIDIVARWPGSTHDSTIFTQSYIRNLFETGRIRNAVLLGDRRYGVTLYPLTPLTAPVSPEEMLYNEAHIRTRNTVERSYGVWKRRFAILSQCMRLRPENVQDVVVATAVLHNIAINVNEPEPPELPGIVVRDAVNGYVEDNTGRRNDGTRRAVIDGYFSRLLAEHQ